MNRPHPLLYIALAFFAAASTSHARLNGVHWMTSGHFHPPQLQIGWYAISHWITPQDGYFSVNPLASTLPPGPFAGGGGTASAPSDFIGVMYGVTLMDDRMNTLAHRDASDLTLVRDAWSLERVAPGADGFVYHLTELTETTDDGFSSELVAPLAIPLSLTSFERDPLAGPDVYTGVFRGTIPAGALGYRIVEPIYGAFPPAVLYNDEAAPFELTLHFTIPEPTSAALVLAAAVALSFPSRDRQGADQAA